MNKQPAVYILASKRNGTLYIGVTSNLVKRIWEHRNNLVEGFTERYGVHNLVWYELHTSMESAIQREKQLKEWKRTWKMRMIEKCEPQLGGPVSYACLTGFRLKTCRNDELDWARQSHRHVGALTIEKVNPNWEDLYHRIV